jgi:hypothetical protein
MFRADLMDREDRGWRAAFGLLSLIVAACGQTP